ncbi:multidrug transporter [Bacillus sp. SRB_331]|nr:multidrug transporter [Bacillus sp. SRB_331]
MYVPVCQSILAHMVPNEVRGSFIASWGMSALYFIVGMSSILLFMKAIGKEKYQNEGNVSQIG